MTQWYSSGTIKSRSISVCRCVKNQAMDQATIFQWFDHRRKIGNYSNDLFWGTYIRDKLRTPGSNSEGNTNEPSWRISHLSSSCSDTTPGGAPFSCLTSNGPLGWRTTRLFPLSERAAPLPTTPHSTLLLPLVLGEDLGRADPSLPTSSSTSTSYRKIYICDIARPHGVLEADEALVRCWQPGLMYLEFALCLLLLCKTVTPLPPLRCTRGAHCIGSDCRQHGSLLGESKDTLDINNLWR